MLNFSHWSLVISHWSLVIGGVDQDNGRVKSN